MILLVILYRIGLHGYDNGRTMFAIHIIAGNNGWYPSLIYLLRVRTRWITSLSTFLLTSTRRPIRRFFKNWILHDTWIRRRKAILLCGYNLHKIVRKIHEKERSYFYAGTAVLLFFRHNKSCRWATWSDQTPENAMPSLQQQLHWSCRIPRAKKGMEKGIQTEKYFAATEAPVTPTLSNNQSSDKAY